MGLWLTFRSVAPSRARCHSTSTYGRFAVAWRYESLGQKWAFSLISKLVLCPYDLTLRKVLKAMKPHIDEIIAPLVRVLDGKWIVVTKGQIESADGRKDRSNPICKKSSCLYLACTDDDSILYVGETSISIKSRFISDGSGSHKSACDNWYSRMTKVKFVTFEEQALPTMHRKLLEQALSIHYKPEFYANRT